jgi:hypothetical protein
MYDHHPDVTDEDIGIRAFKIKKAKAVERAVERMRYGLGPSWKDLNDQEIEELEWVLGELWAYIARSDWDSLRFGHLLMGDVIRILTFGSELRRHARGSIEILRDVEAVVRNEGKAMPQPEG